MNNIEKIVSLKKEVEANKKEVFYLECCLDDLIGVSMFLAFTLIGLAYLSTEGTGLLYSCFEGVAVLSIFGAIILFIGLVKNNLYNTFKHSFEYLYDIFFIRTKEKTKEKRNQLFVLINHLTEEELKSITSNKEKYKEVMEEVIKEEKRRGFQ